MKTHHVRRIIKSPTARLATTYLAIIMLMSVSFSIVFYNTSSRQLGRQLPPDSFFHQFQTEQPTGQSGSITMSAGTDGHVFVTNNSSRDEVNRYIRARIDEGRSDLFRHLLYLNVTALVLGALISYALARRALEPIEESMEAQAQFVSDASHELRTPLTAIQTSNEVFMRRPKATLHEAKLLINQNTEDVKRLKQLSDALLNLAQYNAHHLSLKPVAVQSLVSDATTQVIPQASEKSIAIDDQTENICILGDVATLQQALVVLLDNAIKYSEPGKTITLTTQIKGKTTLIHVRDEGVGIRASDMPHLFRRFYRADAARSNSSVDGYGLGLAIAEQLVENNHGQIEVTSTPGKGSTFSLKLLTTNDEEHPIGAKNQAT